MPRLVLLLASSFTRSAVRALMGNTWTHKQLYLTPSKPPESAAWYITQMAQHVHMACTVMQAAGKWMSWLN